jgi:hypothetical protein
MFTNLDFIITGVGYAHVWFNCTTPLLAACVDVGVAYFYVFKSRAKDERQSVCKDQCVLF